MSSGYEIIQKLYDVQNINLQKLGRTHGFIILALLILICGFLFWKLGLLSAAACFSAIIVGIFYTYFVRFDLWRVSIGSGLVMLLCSLPFYLFLMVLAPEWIAHTYPFDVLTGFKIYGVPIEEFIFWFLAGAMFGPFYEVLNGLREYRK